MSDLIIGEGQDKELFLEFIQFCDKQPKDKKINHMCWSTCAIGDFEKGKDLCVNLDELLGYMDHESLHDKVANPFRCNIPKSYGEFTKFLKSYLPKIDEVV